MPQCLSVLDPADALQGASAGQLKLIMACAVIAASYAVARTIYFMVRAARSKPGGSSLPVSGPMATPVPLSTSDRLDPRLLVILTAAATAALEGKRVAIRRVTFINHNTISGWAEAGRIGIHSSHNIRR